MSKNLTKAQALAAYKRVCKALGEQPHDAPVKQGNDREAWYAGPVLCENFESWYSTTKWAIVLEGGPDEWPLMESVNNAARGTHQAVFAEAINSYSLALYPAL